MAALKLHAPDDDERRIHASLPDVRDRADLYSSRVVRGLLACCGIESADWILRQFSREQIVLVCCYAISRAQSDDRSNAKALALAAFGRRWVVDDRRARVFPRLFSATRPARPWTRPSTRPAAAISLEECGAMDSAPDASSTPPAVVKQAAAPTPPPMTDGERRSWQQMIADAQGRWASHKST